MLCSSFELTAFSEMKIYFRISAGGLRPLSIPPPAQGTGTDCPGLENVHLLPAEVLSLDDLPVPMQCILF